MTLRAAHIIIVLTVTVVFFGFIYVGDYFFKKRFNDRQHRFDRQFSDVKSAMDDSAYERVILICEAIIADDGTGLNEVRAKVYIGLSQLKMDQVDRSLATLRLLIGKYPGLKQIYGSSLASDASKNNIDLIYDSILKQYLPGYIAAVNSEMTPEHINHSMTTKRNYRLGGTGWSAFVALQIMAIALYEKFRKTSAN